MEAQQISGNGEKYSPGYCKICRDSEHGDYGDGRYIKVTHNDYRGLIRICADHYDAEHDYIKSSRGWSGVCEIPSRSDDEA